MTTKSLRATVIGCIALSAAGLSPAASEGMGATLNAFVPDVCSVQALAQPYVVENEIRIDRIHETCNGAGYQLVLQYTPGTLEDAQVEFAGNRIALDGSGHSVIFTSDRPVSRQLPLRIVTSGPVDQVTRLGFHVQRS